MNQKKLRSRLKSLPGIAVRDIRIRRLTPHRWCLTFATYQQHGLRAWQVERHEYRIEGRTLRSLTMQCAVDLWPSRKGIVFPLVEQP